MTSTVAAFPHALQSRSLTYLWTVTEGVLLAMEALEGAVQGALGGGGGGGCGGAGAKAGAGPGNQQQHAEVTRAKGAKDGGAHVGAAGDSRQDKAAPGPEVRLELDAGPAGGGEGEGKQQQQQQHGKQQGKPGWGNGPEEQACGLRGLLSAWASGEAWAWAKPLWPVGGTGSGGAGANRQASCLAHNSGLVPRAIGK